MITVIVVVVEKTESEPREMELGSGGPTEAIVGPTEEQVEEILGINLRGERRRRVGLHSHNTTNSPPLTASCVLSKPPLYLHIFPAMP